MQEKAKRKGIPFFRKLFIFLVIFAIFASIGIWYLNEYFLPDKGKTFVIDFLTKATGRNVTLESIYYNPLRGLTLKNIKISDDPKYERTFLEIKRAYFNVLYLPIFKKKEVIVPLIRIESPKVIFTIDNENKWNFETLAFLQRKEQLHEYRVFISKIAIADGVCLFEDSATEPAFSKELKDIDLEVYISYPLKIKYKLSAKLNIKQKNSFFANGELDPIKKNLGLKLKVKNIPIQEFGQYYAESALKPLVGELTGDSEIFYSAGDILTVSTNSKIINSAFNAETYALKGSLDLNGNMKLDLKDQTKLSCEISAATKSDGISFQSKEFSAKGGVEANSKVSFDIKDMTTLKYSGDALLKEAKVSGVPILNEVERLNGRISFDETKLWADSVTGTSRGLNFAFAGSLKDYKNPYLDLTAKTEFNLSRLNEFLEADLKERLKKYQITGTSKISMKITSYLKDKTSLSYILTSELLNCSIKPDFIEKPITSINGTLISKADSANLKNISAVFNDKTYTVNGDITNFKTPVCNLAINSEDLKINTSFKSLDSSVAFSRLEGNYKNIKFNLFGSVDNFKEPVLGIHGSVATNIQELKNYLPKQSVEMLDKYEVAGEIAAKLIFDGKLKDQKTWQIEVKAESPQLQIKKMKFDDCYVEYKLKDNFVSMPRITAKPYEGTLAANVAIDFNLENPQYVIELDIKEVDIWKLKNDTEFKNNDLKGRLYARLQLGGYGENLETIRGRGQFVVLNGKLWELPVFGGLAAILYIPGLEKIVFKEASGAFTVGNKVIATNNTSVKANEMNLIYDGTMDFDGNLNFALTAALNRNLLEIPAPLGPFRDFFIDEAGNYLGDITLTGTLKEPQHKINQFPVDRILRSKLLEKIRKGLFGGDSE